MLWWILGIVGAIVGLVAITAIMGLFISKQHRASVKALYRESPEAIWKTVTDFEAMPSWRKGVRSVERLPDRDGHPVWVEVSRQGRMPLEIVEMDPPRRMVGRIADPNLPFGGTWTYEITPRDGGAELQITENGEIYNPMFRFMARFIFGHHATMEDYLRSLGRKFGQETAPERVP